MGIELRPAEDEAKDRVLGQASGKYSLGERFV